MLDGLARRGHDERHLGLGSDLDGCLPIPPVKPSDFCVAVIPPILGMLDDRDVPLETRRPDQSEAPVPARTE